MYYRCKKWKKVKEEENDRHAREKCAESETELCFSNRKQRQKGKKKRETRKNVKKEEKRGIKKIVQENILAFHVRNNEEIKPY